MKKNFSSVPAWGKEEIIRGQFLRVYKTSIVVYLAGTVGVCQYQ